jgi:hypothetical protein
MPPMPAAENPKDWYFVILEIEKCVNKPAQRASAIAFPGLWRRGWCSQID